MSGNVANWSEEYQNHAAWNAIEQTIAQCAEIRNGTEDQRRQIERIRLTLRAVLELRDAPTLLVSAAMLDELDSIVRTQIKRELRRWVKADNNNHLNQATAGLDATLNLVRGWPASREQSLRSAAAVLRESVKASNEHLHSLQLRVEETKAALEKQREFVQQQMDRRDDEAIEKARELEVRVSGLHNHLTQLDERLDTLVNDQQARFDQSEQDRMTKHQDLLQAQRNDLQQALQAGEKRAQEVLDTQQSLGQTALDELQELKNKAAEVVSVVATSATADWHRRHADDQKETANGLRKLAGGVFATAFIVTAIWVFFLDHQDDSWRLTIIKTTLSLSLVALGGYLIAESKKHRNEEFNARGTELKLRALDPFIQPIEESKRHEILEIAARTLFIEDGKHRPHEDYPTRPFKAEDV